MLFFPDVRYDNSLVLEVDICQNAARCGRSLAIKGGSAWEFQCKCVNVCWLVARFVFFHLNFGSCHVFCDLSSL